MEDVSDAAFRRVCRTVGAELCVTEFIRAEQMIAGADLARRKAALAEDDRPTAIQIYGADAELLMAAAAVAAAARPAFIDLNCGCWLPGGCAIHGRWSRWRGASWRRSICR